MSLEYHHRCKAIIIQKEKEVIRLAKIQPRTTTANYFVDITVKATHTHSRTQFDETVAVTLNANLEEKNVNALNHISNLRTKGHTQFHHWLDEK